MLTNSLRADVEFVDFLVASIFRSRILGDTDALEGVASRELTLSMRSLSFSLPKLIPSPGMLLES